jgi:glycosyltransferase involved in cell wall biosynthesis
MKILILSFYYHPDLCAGSFRVTSLVEKLREVFPENTEFHILTTMPNRYNTYRKIAPEEEVIENILIKRTPLPPHKSGFLDQTLSFSRYASEVLNFTHTQDYDAVFSTSSRLMTAFLGAIISRYKNIPLYLDIRDLFVDTLSDVFGPKKNFLLAPILKRIEKFSFGQAKKINIVSGGFKDYFNENFPGIPLNTISNGIDDTFLENPEGEFKQIPSPEGKKKVLYAGNIGEGQGLHKIIPMLSKKLEDTHHFFIVGDGGRRLALEEEVVALGLTNVTLLPPVHRDILKSYYSQTDILFLHLNSYDAFEKVLPSKIFEYSVYSKPIWAGVSGFSSEFLKREVKGSFVFSPCSVEEAEVQVGQMKDVIQGREKFIKKYSRSNLMRELSLDFLNFCQENQ